MSKIATYLKILLCGGGEEIIRTSPCIYNGLLRFDDSPTFTCNKCQYQHKYEDGFLGGSYCMYNAWKVR